MNSKFIAEYYKDIYFDEFSLVAVKKIKATIRDEAEKEALQEIPLKTHICLIKTENPNGKYSTIRVIFNRRIKKRLNEIEKEKRLERKTKK